MDIHPVIVYIHSNNSCFKNIVLGSFCNWFLLETNHRLQCLVCHISLLRYNRPCRKACTFRIIAFLVPTYTGIIIYFLLHFYNLISLYVCRRISQINKSLIIIRGHSTLHAGKVLGLLTTVLVLDPPNLVCRDLFGSYNCGLKGFHFGDLQFYSVILSILSKNGPKLPEILKIGSKIKVHQNENPSNHSCMSQKARYIPILGV